MRLHFNARVITGEARLDTAIRALTANELNGETLIYAATDAGGGLSVYRLGASGTLSLHDSVLFAPSFSATLSRDIAVGGAPEEAMLLLGVGDGRLISYGLAQDGTFEAIRAPVPVDPALGAVDRLAYLGDDAGGGVLALSGGGIYRMEADAGLSRLQDWTGPDSALSLMQGAEGVILTRATLDGVESEWVDLAGRVTFGHAVGVEDGFGVANPTAIETVAAHGTQFAVLGAAGTDSLSVLEVSATGALQVRDHLIDSRFSRFADVQDIAVAQVAGQVFVVAGGSDDGLSLLTLLPDGRLVHLDSIASDAAARLDGITRLAAVHAQDALQVIVATQGNGGLAHLSVPMDNIGVVLRGAGVLAGGAGDDLVVAEAAASTLSGGAGDDILVAGPSGTTMTGGVGADLFVMQSGGGEVRITDFNVAQDRLDLSDYTMLRNPDQLTVTRVTGGARIVFRDDVVVIQSHDGTTLGREDLFGSAFDGPDRISLALLDGARSPEPEPTPPGADPGPAPIPEAAHVLLIRPSEPNPWLIGAEITFTPDGAGMARLTADAEGRFDLAGFAGETGRLSILRNYSAGDPAIDVSDALDVLRLAVGLDPSFGPASSVHQIAADFDRDGTVSVSDALGVLRLAVGLPLEIGPEWLFLDPEADLAAIAAGSAPVTDGLRLTVPFDPGFEFLMTAILPGNVDGSL
ncbi:MAG: hypothetical protein RID11_20120 [Roseovarius sp.]|uniref:hypothetical protein n=1 Tax=Roseovarius sp. TaxID=1486281 RepID=UPI0032EDF910